MPEKKLADRIRQAIRLRVYSIRTEKAYIHWYERFVRFHKLRHPATMGAPEVEAFLTYLASQEQVSASTQNQALSALLFLYQEVLDIPLGDLHALRAKKTTYVQPYLSHDECLRILARLDGTPYLVACFLYGSGLRLLEALRLRVKDLDFHYRTITVRDAKGESVTNRARLGLKSRLFRRRAPYSASTF